ncbi:cupredoxin domain-containing protein [Glaciimonas sp. GNP009]
MKSTLIATMLALSLLSMNVFAHGDDGHAKADDKQEGYAAPMGVPGDASKVVKTIEIDMNDARRFTPATISIKRGETVKFVVKNTGQVKHEIVLGSILELKEHAALMIKFPEMEHSDPNQVSVEPGKTGELIWQFNKAGTFDFACLQPGHFEAGMRGNIVVK